MKRNKQKRKFLLRLCEYSRKGLTDIERNCSSCEHLGRGCPKMLMLLPLEELIDWCHYIMVEHKITHERMAQLSAVPKGTIDRIMAKQSADCRYSTVHTLVHSLFELLGTAPVCLHDTINAEASQAAAVSQRSAELEKALETSERERLALQARFEEWTETREFMKKQIAKKDEHIDRLSNTIQGWRRVVKILSALLGVAVLAIIVALIFDRLNPNIGYFWRAGY